MASRKQRRRRQKERRHEYEYVYVDEQGEEVEVDLAEVEERPAPRSKPKATATPKKKSAPFRGGREVPPPSWRRTAKRGLIFGPFMFLTLLLLDRNQAYDLLAINTVVLLAFFLPFSYVLDTLMYRVYVKRAGAQPARSAARRR